jgi:hypothetical protein
MSGFESPIGYQEFHKKQLFNFQWNRWYSLGYARFEDMARAGKEIKTFNDWKLEMFKLAIDCHYYTSGKNQQKPFWTILIP